MGEMPKLEEKSAAAILTHSVDKHWRVRLAVAEAIPQIWRKCGWREAHRMVDVMSADTDWRVRRQALDLLRDDVVQAGASDSSGKTESDEQESAEDEDPRTPAFDSASPLSVSSPSGISELKHLTPKPVLFAPSAWKMRMPSATRLSMRARRSSLLQR
eukprot:NODE_4826_length_637_cov_222.443299.p3 GENE.NODE_4826_length_637_cov_222.443299~~NODE_4826_length_637_cov_222.443299.p3  ORF type:complete len:158 (-),score=35.24 NODE_4826_length_637_cov_222.443299:92-565(-)